jgi:dipicolinate synthase subunit A
VSEKEQTAKNINNSIKIGVIGGDLRQLAVAGGLADMGIETAVYGFEKYGDKGYYTTDDNVPSNQSLSYMSDNITKCVTADNAINSSAAVILPMPYSIDGVRLNAPFSAEDINIGDIFGRFKPNQYIFGGRVDDTARELARLNNIKLFDYYEKEELSIKNAIPTAEGALAIAIQETQVTIHDSDILILGFGRVGRALAELLRSVGARVTVAARKSEDFAWMKVYGYKQANINELEKVVKSKKYTIIFNTVPNIIITKQILKKLQADTLIIDLASKPGGVDMKAAKELKLHIIWALSLPGKIAPITAGEIIKDTVIGILRDEGVEV